MAQTLPTRFEAERVRLRSYQKGDGPWYYRMGQANRGHLIRYESGNVAMSVSSEQEGEALVRELAVNWEARACFFIGFFPRTQRNSWPRCMWDR